ncbi:hypothetical protein PCH_Pc09g00400 [Penicillium rubens Wisconsin 54-1255]|uniref:Uncharacterized protein n=1 Tax=Penicillium rubens (strain ATCC 28089 / DSM 1075 / NRRL 1951 / Wisconsin 54-1255) TaxID=500485 RepID=B6GWN4_PENRW|nr:hypothetical protein PCH_Pc09g00400 [Penicillium rubens Wisconsin 54-1255]
MYIVPHPGRRSCSLRYCLAELTVNQYRPASAACHLGAFVFLNDRGLWRQCDAASAEYGTFSLVKTQRFDPPDILHNMRRRGLSTTGPDGTNQERRFFSSHSGQSHALRGDMVMLG